MNLKALEILKKILKEINDDNLFLSEDFVSNVDIRLSVMELEVLENRKCTDCKFFTKNNAFYGVCAKDVNTTKNQDEWLSNIEFSCNRFEQKEI